MNFSSFSGNSRIMSFIRVFFVLSVVLVYQAVSGKVCDDSNEFRCKDGSCISVDNVCNGRVDCLDHSDELNCGKLFRYFL